VSTTGYGEPIQKLFKLKDGERIIAAYSLDRRVVGDISEREGYYPESYGFAATSDGYALTFGLTPFAEPSTKAGRRYAKTAAGAEVVSAALVHGEETVIAVTTGRRALFCPVEEVSYLAGAGKGVLLVRLEDDDRLLVARPVDSDDAAVVLKTSLGGEQRLTRSKQEVSSRGGKGREVIKRGKFVEVVPPTPEAPEALPPLTTPPAKA
jgi:DNA gyrase subunit A